MYFVILLDNKGERTVVDAITFVFDVGKEEVAWVDE